jgi:hypothetical protein
MVHKLQLVKGDSVYIYKYESGDEKQVIETLTEDVKRGLIDWFDAAVLSHQLGQRLAKEIKGYLT